MVKMYDKEKVKEEFLVSIGSVIRKKRKKKNISQKELSSFLEVSISTISRMERGNSDMPVSMLPLISSYCDFPLTDYVYDEKVQMSTRYFVMLQENTADKKEEPQSETVSEQTEKRSKEYNEMLTDVANHLAEEDADKTVDVLCSAGKFIEEIQEDNEELAREISKRVLNYVYSIDEYIQRYSRVGRNADGM